MPLQRRLYVPVKRTVLGTSMPLQKRLYVCTCDKDCAGDLHASPENILCRGVDEILNGVLFVLATVSIPPGMVQDQFGMMGLLTFIRGAETDPGLVALALGRCVQCMHYPVSMAGQDVYILPCEACHVVHYTV